jgi:aspartyl protease family protein
MMVWLAIIAVLVLGYSMRGELSGSRFMAALMPSRIHTTEDGGLSIDMSQDGHFHMQIEVNGVPLDFMVDTGASDIVLSPQDARRAGYDPDTLNYTKFYNTANGTSKGAPVVINRMVVGAYTLDKVPASVNSASMSTSLLGMTFLRQFKEYRVTGDTLTLYP